MPKIMKLTDVGSTDEEVQKYIIDQEWVMQQKFDGTRIQMQWYPVTGEIVWSNSGEGPVTHSAAKLKLPALEEILRPVLEENYQYHRVTLEGELLIRTGEFIVWDYLWNGPGEDTSRWSQRHRELEAFMRVNEISHPIRISPTARTSFEKGALWELIKSSNVEGAVSKHVDSLYVPGVRTKEWVKHKLVKTADLVVMSAERTFKPDSQVVHKGSASLGYCAGYEHEDGPENPPTGYDYRKFTAASLIGKDLTIDVGDVVEVAYLYREPGGTIVQPRIVRKRYDANTGDGDKQPAECTLDQFPEYSRAVL